MLRPEEAGRKSNQMFVILSLFCKFAMSDEWQENIDKSKPSG